MWSHQDARPDGGPTTANYYINGGASPHRAAAALGGPQTVSILLNDGSEGPGRRALMTVELPDSTEEAFRLIIQGATAEDEGKYALAMKSFLDAGEMLTRVGAKEEDQHIRNLLHQKAMDVLGWTEALANWLDCGQPGPVPQRLGRTVAVPVLERVAQGGIIAPLAPTDPQEFTTLFYTAVTTRKPSNFTQDGYVLNCIQNNRRPKLMVVITMYNEDDTELRQTLRKVSNNLTYLQRMALPGYDNDKAWQNVLVCVVSDGKTKANPSTLQFLRGAGAFDEEAMTITSVGTDVRMHLFEYTLQLMPEEETGKQFLPIQLVFALKEYNAGKLNSHEWYFNAFAEQVMPKYTVLLDVGTLPTKSAFYRLLVAMEGNRRIGGVCGEIAVDRPIPNLCNWVIAAQHYEYKISNVLDKSMESVFGFISVLPGAFSAYRYEAIRGEPLRAYFKALTIPMKELGPFQGNMYLAEDRILCFEIVAKANCRWTLHYVKNAIARTDVPTNLVALIGQRRRWLNGSFFAILYTIFYWGRIYTQSSHSIFRKLVLLTQYFFNVITVVLNWFLVANFYLTIYFVLLRGFVDNKYGFVQTDRVPLETRLLVSNLVQYTYGLLFLIQVIWGLGSKPKHTPYLYLISAVYYGILMAITVVVATLIFFLGSDFNAFTISFATLILGVYFISAGFHCELHHIVMSIVQYFILLPTTINVLMSYSFCNLHDLSWGTKGLDDAGAEGEGGGGGDRKRKKEEGTGSYQDMVAARKAAEEVKKAAAAEKEQLEKTFNLFRTRLLTFWLVSNLTYTFTVQIYVSPDRFLTILYVAIGLFNLWRFIGSTAFLMTYLGDKFYAKLFLKRRMQKDQFAAEELRRKNNKAGTAVGLDNAQPGLDNASFSTRGTNNLIGGVMAPGSASVFSLNITPVGPHDQPMLERFQ